MGPLRSGLRVCDMHSFYPWLLAAAKQNHAKRAVNVQHLVRGASRKACSQCRKKLLLKN